MPALDAQYFTAGIVPTVILIFAVTLVRALLALSRWTKTELSSRQKQIAWLLGMFAGLLLVGGFALSMFAQGKTQAWGEPLSFAGVAVTTAGYFFSRRKAELRMQRLAIGLAWVYVAVGTCWLLLAYLGWWFPNVPHELGGPKLRRVQLDFDTTKVSALTLHTLLPDGTSGDTNSVRRSRSLYLIFDSGDYVLVQLSSTSVSATNQFFKVKKDSIAAIVSVKSQ